MLIRTKLCCELIYNEFGGGKGILGALMCCRFFFAGVFKIFKFVSIWNILRRAVARGSRRLKIQIRKFVIKLMAAN